MVGRAQAIAQLNIFNRRPAIAPLVESPHLLEHFFPDCAQPGPEGRSLRVGDLVHVVVHHVLVLRENVVPGRLVVVGTEQSRQARVGRKAVFHHGQSLRGCKNVGINE